jgi:hypothetical protein
MWFFCVFPKKLSNMSGKKHPKELHSYPSRAKLVVESDEKRMLRRKLQQLDRGPSVPELDYELASLRATDAAVASVIAKLRLCVFKLFTSSTHIDMAVYEETKARIELVISHLQQVQDILSPQLTVLRVQLSDALKNVPSF